MTVAPMIPTARSVASEFGSVGTNTPRATPDPETGERRTSIANPPTIAPTSAVITASPRLQPRSWSASTPNATTAVMSPDRKSGNEKRIARPSAAPVNSARSVAIAIASAWIQRKYVIRGEKRSRQTSARFLPVAIPSFADNDWTIIAIRFAASTTHRSA